VSNYSGKTEPIHCGRWTIILGDEGGIACECRRLLASAGLRSLEPGGELRHLVASEVCLFMLKHLPEFLHKGRALHPEGQVHLLPPF
jgi:hypothetical protein